MPECHNCPVQTLIESGAYRGVPFEQTPCAKCSGPGELSHKGKSHVSRDSSEAVAVEESMMLHSSMLEAPVRDAIMDSFAAFMRQFMALPTITRDIVAFRFLHPERSMSVLADRYDITVQAVHSRLKRALEKMPALRTVIEMRTYGGK